MEFRVLGGLEVRDGDAVVDLGPPKQRAVLDVLLLEAGRVVAADRLVELLWGDDADKAMSALQAYISRLRRALEPNRLSSAKHTVLVSQAPGYRLVVDRSDVDAFRFEDLVAAGRVRLQAGDAEGARIVLDEALALWTGPLLPELADEPFVIDAAARLAAARASAIEAAGEARLTVGDHDGALALLEPETRHDPLRERLHGLYAVALYRAGRQADAVRVVARCRRALVDVAGLDPGRELRRLEADLLAHSPVLDWQPPARQRDSAASTPAAPGSTLVGRDNELGVLAEALAAAAAGHGGVAVVVGEPGIGKTRLVEELRVRATTDGFVTAWARCSEAGAAPSTGGAYWPIVDLARQLQSAGVGEGPVVDLPADTEPVDIAAPRFEVRRAVLAALAGSPVPLLLVLDDLQWADAASLRLVEHGAADLAATRTLLVVTTRPLEENAPAALVDCLGEMARARGCVNVELAGLDADAVAQWLARRSGLDVPAEVTEVIHERTGGHPLFVKELIDLLTAEGRLADPDALRAARAIPPGVQFVVRRRVSRLPGSTQQLLPTAAVVGRSFDVSVVAAVAELSPIEVLDALTPALDTGLVTADAGGLRFSHALVADALADEVNMARRARIHAAAAKALAAAAGPSLGSAAAEIAHHALHGLLAGAGDLAVAASVQAAAAAQARFADEDAAVHWGNAAAALARWRPSDVESRVDALVNQATSLGRADLVPQAKEPALAAIAAASAAGFVKGTVRAGLVFSHAHPWPNEPYGVVDPRVVVALEQTLAAAAAGDAAADPAERAELLGALAAELVFADGARHRRTCDAAVQAARAAGEPETLARVLIDALPRGPDAAQDSLAMAEEVVALAEAHALPPELALAGLHTVAITRFELADHAGAEAALAQARHVYATVPGSRFHSQMLWLEAGFAVIRARYDEAIAWCQEAYEIHRRARGYDADTLASGGPVAVAVDRGGAEELLAGSGELVAVTSYRRQIAEGAAWACTEIGLIESAAALVAPYGVDAPFPDDWTMLMTMTAALHVRVSLADRDGAAAVAELLRPYRDRWSNIGTSPFSIGLVVLALARADALAGNDDAARTEYEAAVSGHERLGAVAWLARSLEHQGGFLLDRGETDAGRAALARAAAIADRHGLVYIRRRIAARETVG